ncbi:MAG: Gldg family protein [Planctomycetota bacterium]
MVKLWKKTAGSKRRWTRGSNVAMQVLLAFWLLVVVNGWAFQYSWRTDLTGEQKWAIDPTTIEFLRQLPQNVEVVIPYRSPGRNPGALLEYQVMERAKRLLEEFQMHTPRLRVAAYVDVLRDPEGWSRLRDEYNLDTPNLIYLFIDGEQDQGRYISVRPQDLARFRLPTLDAPEIVPGIQSENLAEGLTNALRRLLVSERPRVLFSQGHGEIRLSGPQGAWKVESFRQDLVGRGYDVGEIDLLQTPVVPTGTALLVLVAAGPDFDAYRGEARAAIVDHVERGGAVMLFSPDQGGSGLEGALRERGITMHEDWLVAESDTRQPWQLLTTEINGTHPIFSGLEYGSFRVAFQVAHHVEVQEPATALLASAADTWLERSFKHIRREATEPLASYPVVAVVDNLVAEGSDQAQGRWAVFGAWSMVLNAEGNSALRWGAYQGGARQMILRTVNWLTQQELPVAGEGRPVKTTRVVVEDIERPLWWLALVFLPSAPLLAGLCVFFLRRK